MNGFDYVLYDASGCDSLEFVDRQFADIVIEHFVIHVSLLLYLARGRPLMHGRRRIGETRSVRFKDCVIHITISKQAQSTAAHRSDFCLRSMTRREAHESLPR